MRSSGRASRVSRPPTCCSAATTSPSMSQPAVSGGTRDTHDVVTPDVGDGSRRHRLHRAQRAHLPAAVPASFGAERGHPAHRDEHVGPLRRLWAGVRRSQGPERRVRPARSLANPAFLRLLAQVRRFHREARQRRGPGQTTTISLGDFLLRGRFSGYFSPHFVCPLVAWVWSVARRAWRCGTRPGTSSPSSTTMGCCRSPAHRRGAPSSAGRVPTWTGGQASDRSRHLYPGHGRLLRGLKE